MMPTDESMSEERVQSRIPPQRIISLPAFASFIDGYLIQDCEVLNQQLIGDIDIWRNESRSGIVSSNHQGWHSPRDLFLRKEASLRELIGKIASAATMSIRRYWPQYDPVKHRTIWEGWANVNGPGAVNAPHSHTHHLSGVYYVKVPVAKGRKEGMIEFLNPAGALIRPTSFERRIIRPQINFSPKAGQLFIFPSYLRHWVTPHYSEEERISIAFNVAVFEEQPAATS